MPGCFLPAQPGNAIDGGFERELSCPYACRLRVSRVGYRVRENRRVRNGHVERISRGSEVTGLSFTCRDGGYRARGGWRGSSFPLRATAAEPGDARGSAPAEPNRRRENDGDGSSGARA